MMQLISNFLFLSTILGLTFDNLNFCVKHIKMPAI